ncbi:hypothetical protein [Pseudomonas aeruginosa]|uniref:hypothetical protein n=1 Tax=Pseudomonas aeruginosa TaxID=287 RepID=UPI00288087F2|nr:hypothetical protein [Pseudomonas aeruginosa]
MPDIREEFEKWAASHFIDVGSGNPLKKGPNGHYGFYVVATAWKSWQASRAALVIEMPPLVTAEDVAEHLDIDDQEAVEIAHMVNGSIAACASFIKQAGIEVAP